MLAAQDPLTGINCGHEPVSWAEFITAGRFVGDGGFLLVGSGSRKRFCRDKTGDRLFLPFWAGERKQIQNEEMD